MGRLRQIARVLLKFRLGSIVRLLGLNRLPAFAWARSSGTRLRDDYARLRAALEELGPSFIKFGQILSTRADIFDPALIAELEKLQDKVRAEEWPQIEACLEEDLPGDWRSQFRRFDELPIAAGSIAQVHLAELADGRKVAVKVRRPGIISIIEEDMKLFRFLARAVKRSLRGFDFVDPEGLVEEFARQLGWETDFRREMQNQLRFRENFRSNPKILIPRPFASLCTERVLVMEFVDGTKLIDVLNKPSSLSDAERREVGNIGAEAVLEMILVHGFFHADPHPGNMIILDGPHLALLDFGMVASVSPRDQEELGDLLLGALSRDMARVTAALLSLVPGGQQIEEKTQLELEIGELIDEYIALPLRLIHLGTFIQRVLQLLNRWRLHIPTKLLFLGKALSTIESLGSRIHPDFSMISLLEPAVRKLAKQNLDPKRLGERIAETSLDYIDLLRDWPRLTDQLMKQVRDGRIRIHFKMEGMEPMQRTIENVGTRIIMGLICSALLLASGLIVQAGLEPKLGDLPVYAVAGFATAALIGLGLLVSGIRRIIKKRN